MRIVFNEIIFIRQNDFSDIGIDIVDNIVSMGVSKLKKKKKNTSIFDMHRDTQKRSV